jgi:uncharacterized membrane protein YqjE
MVTAATTALVGSTASTVVLYGASLVLVMWTVYDVSRRPPQVLPPKQKALWIIGAAAGWLLFGIVGAAISVFYLVGPRRRLNARR